jgi:hypothetical protein
MIDKLKNEEQQEINKLLKHYEKLAEKELNIYLDSITL